MKKLLFSFFFFLFITNLFSLDLDEIDLPYEYSMDEFEKGIRSFHNAEYELSINYFVKSLKFDNNNNKARYFLGEAYRKGGYEANTLFVWNTLLAMGYNERFIKNKVTTLYNKRGMLSNIHIDKDYILREDIKGFYDDKSYPLFLRPTQIAIDSNNHYYIASFSTGAVVELDYNLNHVKNHTIMFSSSKIEEPYGVAVNKKGTIFISDYKSNVVYKLNRSGILEATIGFTGIGNGGAMLGPKNLLIDDDDNLYVNDSGNKRINKYRDNGEFLFSFGRATNNVEGLISPAGMFFNNGMIYVVDRDTNKILIFDKNGNKLDSFGEEYLDKPYDITMDNLGRFLIVCKDKLWAYEENNNLWYQIDAVGRRLKRGMSIISDKDSNILLTDFDTSRLMVLSLERERYANLNVNIERIFSNKYPDVHVAVSVEKDDGSAITNINNQNLAIYENGKLVPIIGTGYTELKNRNSDIAIVYDRSNRMVQNTPEFKKVLESWLVNASPSTSFSFVSSHMNNAVLESDFNASRLSLLDSLDSKYSVEYTDIGDAIKYATYNMLNRFSKKSIILVTDGYETGKDFEKFRLSDCVELARNNDVKIYILSFGDGPLTDMYKYMANKTGGDYYRMYKRQDIFSLVDKIEKSKGNEFVISYISRAKSRFGKEPINVYLEVHSSGMRGIADSVYYPSNNF